jgi:N4-(beta-N-acetylglucosaminyl)-L-asparaginase
LAITPNTTDKIQIGFIAINKKGEYGAYSLKPGFDYTASRSDLPHEIRKPSSLLQK